MSRLPSPERLVGWGLLLLLIVICVISQEGLS